MVWESPPHILSKVFRKFYKSNNCNKAIDYTRHKYRYWVIFTILVFTPLATVEGIVQLFWETYVAYGSITKSFRDSAVVVKVGLSPSKKVSLL